MARGGLVTAGPALPCGTCRVLELPQPWGSPFPARNAPPERPRLRAPRPRAPLATRHPRCSHLPGPPGEARPPRPPHLRRPRPRRLVGHPPWAPGVGAPPPPAPAGAVGAKPRGTHHCARGVSPGPTLDLGERPPPSVKVKGSSTTAAEERGGKRSSRRGITLLKEGNNRGSCLPPRLFTFDGIPRPQGGPKRTHDGPKRGPRGPQDGSKSAPRAPQEGSKRRR